MFIQFRSKCHIEKHYSIAGSWFVIIFGMQLTHTTWLAYKIEVVRMALYTWIRTIDTIDCSCLCRIQKGAFHTLNHLHCLRVAWSAPHQYNIHYTIFYGIFNIISFIINNFFMLFYCLRDTTLEHVFLVRVNFTLNLECHLNSYSPAL